MNETIQIKYSKKELRLSLIFGILGLIVFILYTILKNDSYFRYAYLASGIIILGSYVYKKLRHYATIKNGVLIKNSLITKRIPLDEITAVNFSLGKYTLTTKNSEMILNTILIDKTSTEHLKKLVHKINASIP